MTTEYNIDDRVQIITDTPSWGKKHKAYAGWIGRITRPTMAYTYTIRFPDNNELDFTSVGFKHAPEILSTGDQVFIRPQKTTNTTGWETRLKQMIGSDIPAEVLRIGEHNLSCYLKIEGHSQIYMFQHDLLRVHMPEKKVEEPTQEITEIKPEVIKRKEFIPDEPEIKHRPSIYDKGPYTI